MRRQKWKTVVDKQSQGTLKLLFSNPSDVIPDHRIYKFAQMLETDPEAALKTAPVSFVWYHIMSDTRLRRS